MPSSIPTAASGKCFATIWVFTYLGDHERLDFACVGNVRANAEVNHGPTTVHGGGSPIGDLRLDDVLLVLVVL